MDAINLFETKPTSRLLRSEAKRILEALLFSAHEPVRLDQLRAIIEEFCPIRPKELRELLQELGQEYLSSDRAFQLDEVGDGFLLRTKETFAPYVQRLHVDRRPERLSRQALEVLAIIAYRQPITRPAIDALRGVDSSGTLALLLERGLAQRAGRADTPGRPTLYTTADRFLRQFGLSSLADLPEIDKNL